MNSSCWWHSMRLGRARLEPGRTLADTSASPLACALVESRAKSGPRHQLRCSWELIHIGANLREQRARYLIAHAWDGLEQRQLFAKRLEQALDLLV